MLGLRDRRLVWRKDEVLARMADEEEAIVEDMIARFMLCYTCNVVAVSRTTLTHLNIIFWDCSTCSPPPSRFALGRGCASE